MHVSAIVKVLLLLLTFFSGTSYAQPFTITYAVVYKVGNGHQLDAKLSYTLTPRVKEAIENGVPITFYQEFELSEPMLWVGDYFDWHTSLWSEKLRYELRYHALTEQYVLTNLATHTRQNFTSLFSALTELGNIKNFILPPEYLVDADEDTRLSLKTGLDLNALPTPMRPGAIISSKWQLDSDWINAVWQ